VAPSAGERVRLDYTGCLKDRVGAAGLDRDEIRTACAEAAEAQRRLRRALDERRYGFDAILDDARALLASLREGRRLVLPRISAHVLGQLLYLFELQTALSGELYGIDAFDQPGVEAGKLATYALMGRRGYEAEAARLARELKRPRAVV
jgi:glucose-6-phosphate isomerase